LYKNCTNSNRRQSSGEQKSSETTILSSGKKEDEKITDETIKAVYREVFSRRSEIRDYIEKL
jgi:hypothetical protein